MGYGRLLFGLFVTFLLIGGLTVTALFLVPPDAMGSLGDLGEQFRWGPTPEPPGQTGEVPGVARAEGVETGPDEDYLQVTFEYQCVATFCNDQALALRIQHVNFTEFNWSTLYTQQVEDDDEFTVALARGGRYRLLLKHPDGRIIMLGEYRAVNEGAHVKLRVTEDVI